MLRDRAVVVTGAGAGLGRAYALEAAREGALVVVNDVDEHAARRTAREAVDLGGAAVACPGSVAVWDDAARLVRRCVDEFGRLDGLVNNAGVLHAGPAWRDDERQLRTIVDVNVLGALFCGVHALRVMVEQGSGSIVNVVSGSLLGMRELSAYGATKGAIASLTWAWAVDTEGTGVRVNAISPIARTEMGNAWSLGDQNAGNHPDPEVIAPAVVYLLSDRSAALRGQIVRFNGKVLGLLAPPRVTVTSSERESWTVDDVAATVDAELAGELVGVGRSAALPPSLVPPSRS